MGISLIKARSLESSPPSTIISIISIRRRTSQHYKHNDQLEENGQSLRQHYLSGSTGSVANNINNTYIGNMDP
jgi:hypothetical protein